MGKGRNYERGWRTGWDSNRSHARVPDVVQHIVETRALSVVTNLFRRPTSLQAAYKSTGHIDGRVVGYQVTSG